MEKFDNRYTGKVAKQIEYDQNRFKYPGLNEVCNRRKVLGAIGFTILGTKLMLSTSGCKSKFSPEEPELPEPELVYGEEKGRGIMMKACQDKGLTTTENTDEQDFYIPSEMVPFKPDWGIGVPGDPHNRPYFAFGEWISPEDGFTDRQLQAAKDYNSIFVNAKNGGKGAIIWLDQEEGLTESGVIEKTVQKLRNLYLID